VKFCGALGANGIELGESRLPKKKPALKRAGFSRRGPQRASSFGWSVWLFTGPYAYAFLSTIHEKKLCYPYTGNCSEQNACHHEPSLD
jgi:hypothetical protein